LPGGFNKPCTITLLLKADTPPQESAFSIACCARASYHIRMRIPLTKYGLPQVVIYPLVLLAALIAYSVIALQCYPDWALTMPWSLLTVWAVELVLLALLIWALCFFRDPARACPPDDKLLLAPADGKVTDIEVVDSDIIGGRTLKIGIFLSIFNVHINRAPCDVRVEKITYKKGRYLNALNPESGRLNESNDLEMVRTSEPTDRLLVRQISGAIARRIVCDTKERAELTAGEKFGMIKFGSRTELYLPAKEQAKCLVKIGDKIKAGVTPLVKYEIGPVKDSAARNT